MIAGWEDEIAAKRVSFSSSVVSAAKNVPTAVFIVDLEASGAPAASGNTTTALISTLASNGFSVSQAPLSADSVAGKDDGAVLAAAKAAVGAKAERLVYGTSRVVSSKDDRGQKIVTVSAEVKAVELSSGRILYSATKQASAVSSTEAQAAAAARSQVGQQIIKGTVLLSPGATAIGLAARGEPLDTGGPQQIRRHGQLTQQVRLALAQGQGGSALEAKYLSHLQG